MAQKALVTVGTDGLSDWVQTPDGVKHMLGTVSVLKFVTELAPGSSSARQTLDVFLASGQSMLTVDVDHMWELLKPHRARWTSTQGPKGDAEDLAISLISSSDRTLSSQRHRQGTTMADGDQFIKDAITNQVGRIEAQISLLQQHAKEASPGSISADLMKDEMERLRDLVAWLRRPSVYGDQSSNSTYYGLPEKLPGGKQASVVEGNANLAKGILATLRVTDEKIDKLVLAGKAFDVAKAKGDLHKLASNVHVIAKHPKFATTEASAALTEVSKRANHIHGLFAQAKA